MRITGRKKASFLLLLKEGEETKQGKNYKVTRSSSGLDKKKKSIVRLLHWIGSISTL